MDVNYEVVTAVETAKVISWSFSNGVCWSSSSSGRERRFAVDCGLIRADYFCYVALPRQASCCRSYMVCNHALEVLYHPV